MELNGDIAILTDKNGNIKLPRTIGSAVNINGEKLDEVLDNIRDNSSYIESQKLIRLGIDFSGNTD